MFKLSNFYRTVGFCLKLILIFQHTVQFGATNFTLYIEKNNFLWLQLLQETAVINLPGFSPSSKIIENPKKIFFPEKS